MPYKDTDKQKATNRQYAKNRRQRLKETRPWYWLISNAKHRSKLEGVPFNLTEDTLPERPERCPCCGIKFIRGGAWKEQPSLDRVVPSDGYVIGNVQWLCRRCNQIKSNASPEELMRIALFVTNIKDEDI